MSNWIIRLLFRTIINGHHYLSLSFTEIVHPALSNHSISAWSSLSPRHFNFLSSFFFHLPSPHRYRPLSLPCLISLSPDISKPHFYFFFLSLILHFSYRPLLLCFIPRSLQPPREFPFRWPHYSSLHLLLLLLPQPPLLTCARITDSNATYASPSVRSFSVANIKRADSHDAHLPPSRARVNGSFLPPLIPHEYSHYPHWQPDTLVGSDVSR